MQHRGVCNLAMAQAQVFGVSAESRVLQFASISFDAVVSEIFKTLLTGATLVSGAGRIAAAGRATVEGVAEQRSAGDAAAVGVGGVAARGVAGLRTVISAGEACTRELVAQLE